MNRKIIASLVSGVAAVMFLAACTANESPSADTAPAVPVPGRGLISAEGELVKSYASCLRTKGAEVTDVIGVYVVAKKGSGDGLKKADDACQDERTALYKSLEDGHDVLDDDGNRFWYFVRGCMETGLASYPRVAEDLLVVADGDEQYAKDFRECVEIARGWPGETPGPGQSEWPVYPSRSAKGTPG
ncbi:hypothetical protein [Actinoplanes couchii]|uniref:Lipoprotein n=1 Tax=Actinoplanes couchii TaxID=403638 RepID=A0ABQ3XI28_9ACTN|nr:hypothetical protein [Actinoplanes couchii]MDR6324581.1 hypothetical protein [Actinoplanes couchii]GID58133.1 hypothetical protein Aco03nite_065370 [Actinoplanes couchii]